MLEDVSNSPSTNAFSEYVRFEPSDSTGMAEREEQNRLFQTGKVTSPSFKYPKLREEDLSLREQAFTTAIESTTDEAEKALLVARRKGVEIAQASLGLVMANEAGSHAGRWQAGQEFVEKSEARYGALNPARFWPVIAARTRIVNDFTPANLHASMTKDKVLALLPKAPEGTEVKPIIEQSLLDEIRPEVMAYIEPILSVLPEEGEFTSDEIKTLGEEVLKSTGLAEKGWMIVQNAQTKIFSTARSKKQIIVPNPTQTDGEVFKRSAGDLRRLFSHEVGVHAMWGGGSDPDLEEGIAILLECVVSNSTDGAAIQRAESRYLHVGLADGVDGVLRNARQVFEITWRLEAIRLSEGGIITPEIEATAKESVQIHIDNIFRGTDHKLPGVHYNKVKLYLEGIVKVSGYAKDHAKEVGWLQRAIKQGINKKTEELS